MKEQLIIMYDYDGTLAEGSIQEPFLIPFLLPEYKDRVGDFWAIPNKLASGNGYDSNIMYMNVLLDAARKKDIILTRDFLRKCGSYSKVFKGLDTWFTRINTYAESKGIEVKHYIISSGNTELLVGSPIAHFFDEIYACKFQFDEETNGAIAVALSLDEHAKLRFIDEIRTPKELRGAMVIDDNKKIPFNHMIYIGDGFTDVQAMREITSRGGHAFVVHTPDSKGRKRAETFTQYKIVNAAYSTGSCYKENSQLEKSIKGVIDRLAAIKEEEKSLQLDIFDFM